MLKMSFSIHGMGDYSAMKKNLILGLPFSQRSLIIEVRIETYDQSRRNVEDTSVIMFMEITLPTQEEIHDAYQAGEEAVQRLFVTVSVQVDQLASHVQELHDVSQPTQYGPNVKAHAAYLTSYHYLPVERAPPNCLRLSLASGSQRA